MKEKFKNKRDLGINLTHIRHESRKTLKYVWWEGIWFNQLGVQFSQIFSLVLAFFKAWKEATLTFGLGIVLAYLGIEIIFSSFIF